MSRIGYISLAALFVALLLAAKFPSDGVLTPVGLVTDFIKYLLAFGAVWLIAVSVYFGVGPTGAVTTAKVKRPNKSKNNELGSGDLATKSHIAPWLKKTNDDDTALLIKDIKGSDGLVIPGQRELYIPGEERNRHVLFIAKTGSGKTTKAILPVLYHDCLSPTRTSIVIDSKPEMWDKLAGMTRKLNPNKKIILFNPLDKARSLSWNIVGKVDNDTDCKLIANTIIMATDQPNAKSDSPFFRNNALQLLNAMMVGLLKDPDERLSIPRVHELMHSGKDALCNWLEAHPHALRSSRTFVELARSGSQNADTVLSELSMRLSAWDLPDIRATTFAEELDLQTLVDEPCLFIIEFRESEIEMLRPMANTIVIELLRFLTKHAESCPGQKLPRPVGLVIDEFASALGRLPDIHVKLNTLRSRNVSIVAAIQSIAQVKANYDKDADSVLAGFSTKILMPNLDQADADWASKETGQMTVRYHTENVSRSRKVIENLANKSKGQNEFIQQRAVLTADEIGRPLDNAATFFLPNTPAFQGHLVPYYADSKMKVAVGLKADFTQREKPIEYEEILPEKIVHEPNGGSGNMSEQAVGAAIGAIRPNTKVVHTNANQISPEELRAQLEIIKARLGWEQTEGVAREWWETFEAQNAQKLPLVYALTQEIEKRQATIYEFFVAYVYSESDNIEENLKFLDRMKDEQRRQGEPPVPQAASA